MVWLPDHIWEQQKKARQAAKGGGDGGKGCGAQDGKEEETNYDDIASFVAYWDLDTTCQEVLLTLDPRTQKRVMHGFHPPELAKANKMFMAFAKSVKASGGGFKAQEAFGGSFGSSPTSGADNPEVHAFVAQWGLDEKCQEVIYGLDPATQQRIMSGFYAPELSRANRMFMGFVKSVTGKSFGGYRGGASTAREAYGGSYGDSYGGSYDGGYGSSSSNFQAPVQTSEWTVEEFVAHWGLDDHAKGALLSLEPDTQKKLMRDFKAPDVERPRVSRMFMGFVKSVTGKTFPFAGKAPTAQQAFGGGASTASTALEVFGGGAPATQKPSGDGSGLFQIGPENPEVNAFVFQWGLDEKCQEILYGLDPDTQNRIMKGFNAPDLERANRMFMGFVRSITGGKFGATAAQSFGGGSSNFEAPTAQQAFGGGSSIQAPIETGNPAIDTFVAAWGLDARAQEVLCSLDVDSQMKVMNEFQPSDISRANQIFMGFVKTVRAQGGAPTAQQAFDSYSSPQDGTTAQLAFSQPAYGNNSSGSQGDASVSQQVFGNNSSGLQGGSPTAQQALGNSGTATVDESPEGQLQYMMDLLQHMSQPTTGSGFDKIDPATFIVHWGLDQKSQDVLSTLDPDLQQKVMSGFQPKDLTRANQIFMGFVKSVRASGGPTAQLGSLQASAGTGNPVIDGFLAQWGLDSKCRQVLCGLDPATQQRIMSGFNAPDISRANQMFMGFVKSVTGRTSGAAPVAQPTPVGLVGGLPAMASGVAGSPGIDAWIAQWGLDAKCREVLSSLDSTTQERVMSGFAPTDLAQASRMFMGFVKSVSSKTSRFSPY